MCLSPIGDDYISRMRIINHSSMRQPISRESIPPLPACLLELSWTTLRFYMEMRVQQWLHIFIARSSLAPPCRSGIQILAAPLTCSPRMIYAAMQRRSRATSTAIARVGLGVGVGARERVQ